MFSIRRNIPDFSLLQERARSRKTQARHQTPGSRIVIHSAPDRTGTGLYAVKYSFAIHRGLYTAGQGNNAR